MINLWNPFQTFCKLTGVTDIMGETDSRLAFNCLKSSLDVEYIGNQLTGFTNFTFRAPLEKLIQILDLFAYSSVVMTSLLSVHYTFVWDFFVVVERLQLFDPMNLLIFDRHDQINFCSCLVL